VNAEENFLKIAFCHPNIVDFIGSFTVSHHRIQIFELLLGGSLARRIDDKEAVKGCFNDLEIAKTIQQISSGLKFMHAKKIYRRDIKPDNIMFADPSFDTIKIIDFNVIGFGLQTQEAVSTCID
jgi:serine/threonine protein kinase